MKCVCTVDLTTLKIEVSYLLHELKSIFLYRIPLQVANCRAKVQEKPRLALLFSLKASV